MQNRILYQLLLVSLLIFAVSQAKGQLQASFIIDLEEMSCSGQNVSFINTSTGANTYQWDLGGISSSVENPVISFVEGGQYQICLTASDGVQSDIACQTMTLFDAPSVSFSSQGGGACPPVDVSFQATADMDITEWIWDFGDGNTLTTTTPFVNHSYTNGGSFDVTLLAQSANGCTTTIINNDEVIVSTDVTLQVGMSNYAGCSPLTTSFINLSQGNLENVSFEWNFGDGSTSTDFSPSHQYTQSGTYQATLTATNTQNGCINTLLSETIYVGELAGFTFEAQTTQACNSVAVLFENQSIGDIINYAWDFGDGNISNQANPNHTYYTSGCFFPSLTITTADGCTDTFTASECIAVSGNNTPLTYSYQGQTSACQPPLTLSFETELTENITWDFGGEGESSSPNPTFTFQEYGTFPVTLTSQEDNGCEQSTTQVIVEITPPSVDFLADNTRGCSPLTVNFQVENNTAYEGATFDWDFGNGQVATGTDPSNTFTDIGTYNIQLIITTAEGCTDTLLKEAFVAVGTPPTPNFEANPLETCIENAIAFTDLSVGDADQWYWDFGDGGTSTEQNPLHEYNDTGYFDVKLIVWNNGCADSITFVDYLHLLPPKAIFTAIHDCSIDPYTVTFNDMSIGADQWHWDFGDGNISTLPSPSHTYSQEGVYQVTLTVTNDITGCTDFMTYNVHVKVPLAHFIPNETSACINGNSPAIIPLTNLSQNAVAYQWIMPSGVSLIANGPNNSSPKLKFFFPGEYTNLKLQVTDINGCQDLYVYSDTIFISKATAGFAMQETGDDCDQTFTFTHQANSALGTLSSWHWNFGDGFHSTEQNPQHIYAQSGFYAPSLTVEDSYGCTNTFSTVSPIQVLAPQASFFVDTTACLGENLEFFNTTVQSAVNDFHWDFGDGNTSSSWNPHHIFTEIGAYNVCLYIEDVEGCQGVHCKKVYVSNPQANFLADTTTASCPNLVVHFTDYSSDAVAWLWDFGDNTGFSSLQNPTHIYTAGGSYTVCLTVTSAGGCSKSFCKENYIQIGGPSGSFNASPAEGCLGKTIEFEASASGFSELQWVFGDGNSYSSSNANDDLIISHQYNIAGSFPVSLFLTDSNGCTSMIKGDTIQIDEIIAAINIDETQFCGNEDLSLALSATIQSNNSLNTPTWIIHNENNEYQYAGQNISDAQIPNHGTYEVSLIVSTENCVDTIFYDEDIDVLPSPSASFTYSATSTCGSGTFIFTNTSTIPSEIPFTEWRWTVNDEVFTTQNIAYTFSEAGNYEVVLEATADNGCSSTYATTVTIFLMPLAEITEDEIILCQGQYVDLYANTHGTLEWSPSAGLSCTDCPNPTANPSTTTTYYLKATTHADCQAIDSIKVVRLEVEAPQVTITSDTTICLGEIIQIVATGGASPFDYAWQDTPGLSCYQNCSNPIATVDTTTAFVVEVTNEMGCTSRDTTVISIAEDGIDLLGDNRTICLGDSIQLSLPYGENPSWQAQNSLSCYDCDAPFAFPEQTTTYRVSVLNELGCTVEDEVTIEVMLPSAIDAGEDLVTCPESQISLQGTGIGEIIWYDNYQPFGENELNPTISPSVPTTYTLVVTNDLCVASDTVFVDIKNELEISGGMLEICEGETTELVVLGEGSDFDWSPSEFIEEAEGNVAFTTPLYSSQDIVVRATQSGCQADTALFQIIVRKKPSIELPSIIRFMPDEMLTLNPAPLGSETYEYAWEGTQTLDCPTCASPSVLPREGDEYRVTITNEYGCSASDSLKLSMLRNCETNTIIVANAFTPNGDGLNDRFMARTQVPVTVFRVFNRWGELVYEANNVEEGWDGNHKGKPASTGVYSFYIEAVCPINNKTFVEKGDVMLMR